MSVNTFITKAFEQYLAQKTIAGETVRLTEFVFANLPSSQLNALTTQQVSVATQYIVHRQAVSKTGMVNQNAVVYSCTMGTDVGDFNFNCIGLLTETGQTAVFVKTGTISKTANRNGQQGNSLTRSILLEFAAASERTNITTHAETWQIDFTARLSGIDERIRLTNLDLYGDGVFFEEGYLTTRLAANQYQVNAGLAYIKGFRAQKTQSERLTVRPPAAIYVDVAHNGTVTGAYDTQINVTTTRTADYRDNLGVQHYVLKIADIDRDGNVIDRRTLAEAKLRALQRELQEHGHTINQITGLSEALNGLSSSKASASHRHSISDVTNLQAALNDKANTYHSHGIIQITGLSEALNGLSSSKASKATTLAGYGILDSVHFVHDNYSGDLNDLEGKNVAYAINHESNSNANFPPGLAYKWGILQTMSTGMFTRQIYYPDSPAGGIWTRNKFQSNDWSEWHRVDVSALFETLGDVTNLCLDPSLLDPKLGFTWSAGSTQGELVGGKNTRVVSARDNIYGRKIKVRDGDRYYISCEYKRKQGSAPFAPGLYLDFDKNTRRTARAVSLIPSNQIGFTLSNEFERFEGYVDIPYGVETAQLWLQIDQYNTNATQYYVRNVEWRRMTSNVVSVLSGVINNGGVLPLPAGFAEEECRFMVSVNSSNPNGEQWDWSETVTGKHYRTVCSNTGRTVQCLTYVNEGISGNGSTPKIIPGMANYLVIGVKN